MASTTQKLRERLQSAYADLNDREQRLLRVMVVVVSLAAVAIIGLLVNSSLDAIRSDIDTYKENLTTLSAVAPKYRGSGKGQDEEGNKAKFAREKIEENDIKLTSFVATHATAVGVQVDSYDENERPIGGGDDDEEDSASLFERRVTVKIREAPIDKLMALLERIETSDRPVVVERVTLNRKRRAKGKVRASLVVTTFKRKGQG